MKTRHMLHISIRSSLKRASPRCIAAMPFRVTGMRSFFMPLVVLLVPGLAHAQALSQVAGLFNILVGLMLVAAFLAYFGGLAAWFARLGAWPTNRDEAIRIMQYGVVILFVLAVFLALSQFIQEHAALAAFVVGVVVIGLLMWFILSVATAKSEEEEH